MKYFVIGMSKCGTSSLTRYFSENNLKTLHYFNTYKEIIEKNNLPFQTVMKRNPKKEDFIGLIIKENIKNNKPLFNNILDFDVITQMDYSGGPFDDLAFFPQIDHLNRLLKEYPDSKYILNIRPFDDWYKSLLKWYRIDKYYFKSKLKNLNTNDKEGFEYFFFSHINNVIKVFSENNKLNNLLIFDIKNDTIDKLNHFTGLNKIKNLPHLNKNQVSH